MINTDGEIVTNAHVVTDAAEAGAQAAGDINEADEVYVEFGDRNQVPAEIVGIDPDADIALIKVEPDGLDLDPIEFGDSDAVEVGTPVAAIGSPFGQEQSLSTGIVSATDRSIESLTQFRIDGAIQTDASINPGNSGGPLIGADGKVIGVNQQINTTSGGNEGVGFAIPIEPGPALDRGPARRRRGRVRLHRRHEPAALPAARRGARHRRPDRLADLRGRARRARRRGRAAGRRRGRRREDRVPGPARCRPAAT